MLDPTALLRGGANLIGDIDAQIGQQQQADTQSQQLNLQAQKFAAEQATALRGQQRQQQYLADVSAIGGLPRESRTQAISDLMLRYPEFSEQAKRAWDTQAEEIKTSHTREAAELLSLVDNGRPELAAKRLRTRIEADRKAGQDTEEDEAALRDLESGDPTALARVKGSLISALSLAVGPDKFASTLSALDRSTEFEKRWDFIRRTYGQPAADTLAQGEYDKVFPIVTPEGTAAYRSSQLVSGAAPTPIDGSVAAPAATSSPASEDEGTAILSAAKGQKFITPEDLSRLRAGLEPRGHGAVDAYLKKFGIQVGREINGKRYVKRGNDWFEVTN